jgi:transposase
MRETGNLTPGRAKGRPPIMNTNALKVLKKIVEKNNDKTLEEYSELLKIETNISVCKSTIENLLKKLNYNKKRSVFLQKNSFEKT